MGHKVNYTTPRKSFNLQYQRQRDIMREIGDVYRRMFPLKIKCWMLANCLFDRQETSGYVHEYSC